MLSIPIISYFKDVLLTNLLGLHLECNIDFSIKFELCTKPILVPPYQMYPQSTRSLVFSFKISLKRD